MTDGDGSGSYRRAWAVYLAVLLAAAPVYYLILDGLAQRLLYDAFGFSAVVAIVVGMRAHRPSQPGLWVASAAGLTLFTGGDVALNIYELQGGAVPVPSLADGLYFAAYPVLAWGMVLLVRSREPGRDVVGGLDATMVAIAGAVLAWVFVIDSYVDDATLATSAKLVATGYPALDLVLLAVMVRALVSPSRRNSAFWLLVAGMAALLVADAAYAVALVQGTYTVGGPIDFGYFASYALWGAAALHPSMRDLTNRSEGSAPRARLGLLAGLGAAALIAPVTLIVQEIRGARHDIGLLGGASTVMFALVLIRVALLARALEAASRRRTRDERRFRAMIQKSSDVVVLIGADGTVSYAAPRVEALLGRPAGDFHGSRPSDLAHPDDQALVRAQFARLVAAGPGAVAAFECRVRHADGTWRTVDTVATNLLDDPDVGAVVLNARDVTDRRALEDELNRRAFHDPLTGLANRALFLDRVGHALSRADRRDGPVAVLFLDLDDFKLVNDSLGHPAGDRLLVAVAERLTGAVRGGDTVARFGGDEFAILLESGAMPETALEVADRVAEALGAPLRLGPDVVVIQASIGVALGQPPLDTPDTLLRDADLAMYLAKRNGKGRFEMFRPGMHDEAARRLELTADLRRAIEGGQLEAFYQPIFDVGGSRAAGAEALVRWHHPRRGLVPPGEFVGVAESTGLIVPLGRWILAEACRQAAAWRKRGAVDDSFYVSVNLSARQLADPALVDDVADILAATGLPARALVLEITESSLIRDDDSALRCLRSLKHLGLRLALDDFGTGYSSLHRLGTLPIDVVKIDKSFIDRLTGTAEGTALVRSVVEVTQALGMSSVAEGVETPEQVAVLAELGCDYIQGYLYARPAPAAGTTRLLEQVHRRGLALMASRTGFGPAA